MKRPLLTFGAAVLLSILGFCLLPLFFPIRMQEIRPEAFQSVNFYDRHGNLLQEVLSENESRSIYIPVDKVTPYFIQALIAAEDQHFHSHLGVDVFALFRAFLQNLQSGRVVSGASTLTMQLARMMHPGPRTIPKKFQEIFYALRLEAGLSKSEILEAYINRLPMGGNQYGVEAGARNYLGVSASDLTLAQATFLASIPNAPNRLNPYCAPDGIKARQRTVLNRMVEEGFIPDTRIDGVLKEDMRLRPQTASFLAPHFVFHLMKRLPEDVQEVHTTLDGGLQKMVREQIQKVLFYLKSFHVTHAAVLLLDNATGDVLAYVGSADFFDVAHEGQNDGVQALRQPGSTLKPFLYQLAMEKGYHPATLISDLPVHYRMPVGIYTPRNYSELFRGPIRLREALANSLNVPAVRVLADLGMPSFLDRLHSYGFHSLNKSVDHYGVGLVLGNGEVTLEELTRAYLCLANEGRFLPLRKCVLSEDTETGMADSIRVISTQQTHFIITDILSDPFARTAEFGFNTVLNLPFPCAVKTGTSFRFCDNYTVGYTEDYTLGVWVGNFDHTPMQKVSGISGAGPIFSNIMQMLYHDQPYPEKPAAPAGLKRIKACPLSGKQHTPGCSGVIEEWIPESHDPQYQSDVCDIHGKSESGDVMTTLPRRYQTWADELGLNVETSPHPFNPVFEIVHPVENAVYVRISNLAPEYQSLKIQLKSPQPIDKVSWYINGRILRQTMPPHEILWPIVQGRHCLIAENRSAPAQKDTVWFSVE